jgi:hypothetical protein
LVLTVCVVLRPPLRGLGVLPASFGRAQITVVRGHVPAQKHVKVHAAHTVSSAQKINLGPPPKTETQQMDPATCMFLGGAAAAGGLVLLICWLVDCASAVLP